MAFTASTTLGECHCKIVGSFRNVKNCDGKPIRCSYDGCNSLPESRVIFQHDPTIKRFVTPFLEGLCSKHSAKVDPFYKNKITFLDRTNIDFARKRTIITIYNYMAGVKDLRKKPWLLVEVSCLKQAGIVLDKYPRVSQIRKYHIPKTKIWQKYW